MDYRLAAGEAYIHGLEARGFTLPSVKKGAKAGAKF